VPLDPEKLGLTEEQDLLADHRLAEAVALFNSGEWYACHDYFEALWHETAGGMRPVLQGILQIAVAELHLEQGNIRGATILMGEGVGRLKACPPDALNLDLVALSKCAMQRLQALQYQKSLEGLELPKLLEVQSFNRYVN
jgi:uncharacterized protein